MKLFDLFATLSLDLDGFTKPLKESEKQAKDFSQSYSKGFESAAKTVFKFGAMATAAVGALGAIGVNYNTQMETYTTNFEVMLGSTEKAVKKVEELKKFSQSTPFELGDLAQATQTLLAFNVSAEDSTGVLQMLGDISLGNADKLTTLTRAYGKMYSSQKVNLESINMMIDAGYNPLLAVQEKTGESMDEVYSRISKGQVSFEELEDAMKSATSEGGQFYKGMETASKTTAGLVSTAKDLINSKLGEFFQGVSDKIKELLPRAIEFLENLDVKEITKNMQSLYEKFVAFSPILMGVVAGATALYLGMKALLIIKAVSSAMEFMKNVCTGATIAQNALNVAMALGMSPVILIIGAIAALVAVFVTLWNTNEGFRNFFINAWETMSSVLKKVYDSTLKPIIDNLVKLWNNLWTNSLKPLWDNFMQMVSGFIADAQKLWQKLEPIFNFIGDIIKNVVIFYFQQLVSYWTWVVDVISGTINTVFTIFTKIAEIIFNALNGVITFVQTVWSGIKDFITNPVQSSINFLNGMVNQFKDWVEKALSIIKKTFAKVSDIGKDIVRGLWNGISSMGSWISNKVTGFFGGITQKVKDLFGIKSPSRVFAYFGKMNIEGFVGGIKKGKNAVDKVLDTTFGMWSPEKGSVFDGITMAPTTTGKAKQGANVTINIDGAMDPQAVAYEVNRLLGGYI